MSIVVAGSLNMDYIMQVDELPHVGETVFSKVHTSAAGGKGANQAAAAARLGADVKMLGCTGDDDAGRALVESLRAFGVDVSAVLVEPSQPTGSAFITVSSSGANTIVVHRGANFALSSCRCREYENLIAQANVLVTQLEIPLDAVITVLELARRHHVITVLNPAPSLPIPGEVLELADYLVPNETEAASLLSHVAKDGGGVNAAAVGASASPEPLRAGAVAAARLARVTRGTVVVTLGEHGCVACKTTCLPSAPDTNAGTQANEAGAADGVDGLNEGEGIGRDSAKGGARGGWRCLAVPAFKVKAVDTTAAGDAFVGALAYELDRACAAGGGAGLHEFDLEEALRFASAAGALAATKVGAQPSLPAFDEVAGFMRAHTR